MAAGTGRAAVGAGTLLILVLGGCGWMHRDRPTTYPVRGSLFVQGRPAAGATVLLTAMGDPKLARLCPHALVEADGSFRLTTFTTGDGAPAGIYALTLTWPAPPRPGQEEGPDRLRGRYADPRKPVRQVAIAAGDNALEPLQLK
jgi:hypothetical protein